MITKRSVITGISGHPMSGLWNLSFDNGDFVHIQSGSGVRALASAFGATEGSGDLQEKIIGQEIIYSVDFMGVMYGFTPAEEWDENDMPEIPEEGIEEKEDDMF
jgi:hypothetical protein